MKGLMLAMSASAALLAGCSTMDDNTTAPVGMADMTPEERAAYVAMAASRDLYEIQSGQLAGQRAQRADLRQFGQMLVTHHTQTTEQLTAAARASGMTPPPPTLLPMHREMLAALQAASGNFDSVFLDQQVTAHEMALALHRNYARRGDTPALRSTAGAAVPIIQQHLRDARRLDR